MAKKDYVLGSGNVYDDLRYPRPAEALAKFGVSANTLPSFSSAAPRASTMLGSRRIARLGMTQEVERNRSAILEAAARHGARNVRVFGSVARGDDRPDSDLDLLVDMGHDRSLLDLVGLAQELEALLRRRVDVLTEDSLAPSIRQRIAADAHAL